MQTYKIRVGEASAEPIKNTDKVGGLPTYLPNEIPKPDLYGGHFVIELYNHGFDEDEDIICWQFYQGEFGSDISHVIEIRKGSPLYDDSSKLIEKRRWIHEYPLILEPCEAEEAGENISRIGGVVAKEMAAFMKRKKIRYVAVIKGNICPNNEFNSIYDTIIGFDKNGKMNAWTYVDEE